MDGFGLAMVPPERRVLMLGQALTLTSMPAAVTELGAVHRFRALVNLATARQVRLIAHVSTVGFAGSVVRLQWGATDLGSFAEFQATNLPSATIDALGVRDSGWVDVPAGAKAEVILLVNTALGNGVVSPVIGRIEVLVR